MEVHLHFICVSPWSCLQRKGFLGDTLFHGCAVKLPAVRKEEKFRCLKTNRNCAILWGWMDTDAMDVEEPADL
ncbi:hypothetical protein L798_14891 [Zootermopsis nevadensis]|uniref:Uncharacterized protein n=1 Tax=Zootermopsis nevadensis TaxID=136037 RepID=A0A067QPI5_ZOONE|nr:hypothetical protein L798_14891 [Zootermopsis nevadensis]